MRCGTCGGPLDRGHQCSPCKDPRPEPRRCTCGAQQFRGCFCNLTLSEFLTAHPDRSV